MKWWILIVAIILILFTGITIGCILVPNFLLYMLFGALGMLILAFSTAIGVLIWMLIRETRDIF